MADALLNAMGAGSSQGQWRASAPHQWKAELPFRNEFTEHIIGQSCGQHAGYKAAVWRRRQLREGSGLKARRLFRRASWTCVHAAVQSACVLSVADWVHLSVVCLGVVSYLFEDPESTRSGVVCPL